VNYRHATKWLIIPKSSNVNWNFWLWWTCSRGIAQYLFLKNIRSSIKFQPLPFLV